MSTIKKESSLTQWMKKHCPDYGANMKAVWEMRITDDETEDTPQETPTPKAEEEKM